MMDKTDKLYFIGLAITYYLGLVITISLWLLACIQHEFFSLFAFLAIPLGLFYHVVFITIVVLIQQYTYKRGKR